MESSSHEPHLHLEDLSLHTFSPASCTPKAKGPRLQSPRTPIVKHSQSLTFSLRYFAKYFSTIGRSRSQATYDSGLAIDIRNFIVLIEARKLEYQHPVPQNPEERAQGNLLPWPCSNLLAFDSRSSQLWAAGPCLARSPIAGTREDQGVGGEELDLPGRLGSVTKPAPLGWPIDFGFGVGVSHLCGVGFEVSICMVVKLFGMTEYVCIYAIQIYLHTHSLSICCLFPH